MNCPEKESLSAYADGELAGEEGAALASHLETCRFCAARVRAEKALKNAVCAAAPLSPMPDELRKSLRRLGPARPERTPGWLDLLRVGLLRPSAAVSFAAAGLCAAVWVFGRGGRDSSGDLSLDMLLAAHSQYAMTMPLAPVESIVAGLPSRITGASEEEPDVR